MPLLLNKSKLAESLGRSRGYITAMIAAGYEMEYGSFTTVGHALRWLKANRSFRSTGYWSRKVLSGTPSGRAPQAAGKPCEPLLTNDR